MPYNSHYVKGKGAYLFNRCSVCGNGFRSRYRGKKTAFCKKCKKDTDKQESEPSSCSLYMFLEKIRNYEPFIYEMIKMMDTRIVIFNEIFGRYYFSNYPEISKVGKYRPSPNYLNIRYNTRVCDYFIRNKERLEVRSTQNSDTKIDIIPTSIPLAYLPYFTINYKFKHLYDDYGNCSKTIIEEEVFIDYDYYELCLLRRIFNKEFNTYFNPKVGGLECLTKPK